jgi:hypothetical protein
LGSEGEFSWLEFSVKLSAQNYLNADCCLPNAKCQLQETGD